MAASVSLKKFYKFNKSDPSSDISKFGVDSVINSQKAHDMQKGDIAKLRDILLSNLNLVEQQEKMLISREKEILQLQKENSTVKFIIYYNYSLCMVQMFSTFSC